MKKKKKILKPIELDLYLKYKCPNNSCNISNWLTLKEAKTKKFIIVCDCGCISKPKQIDNIKILYKKKNKTKIKNNQSIPLELLDKATKIMIGLGYGKQESTKMLTDYYSHNPITDYIMLVKNTIAISNIGDIK